MGVPLAPVFLQLTSQLLMYIVLKSHQKMLCLKNIVTKFAFSATLTSLKLWIVK